MRYRTTDTGPFRPPILPTPDDDPERAAHIRQEQVRLLYTQAPAGLLATYICIAVMAIIPWQFHEPFLIVGWGLAALVITSLRGLVIHSYWRAAPVTDDVEKWARRYIVATAWGGLVWGATAVLIFLTDSLTDQVFLIFMMGGVAAGAMATLTPLLISYRVYSVFAVVPGILALLARGGKAEYAIAVLLVVYLVLLLRSARNLNLSTMQSLALGLENSELVATLSVAKESAEQANRDLHLEMQERREVEATRRAREERLQRQQQALLEFTRHESIGQGTLESVLRRITETAAGTLEVARVGVWLYDDDLTTLHLMAATPQMPPGQPPVRLPRSAFPAYFQAIDNTLVLAVDDVHRDPRTAELMADYLVPAGVTALLDAPIRLGGRPIGVLCSEHTGAPRTWSLEEQNFAAMLAEMTALALDQHHRRQAEEALFEEKERALVTLKSIGDGVITTDVSGMIEYINPVAEQRTGWTLDEARGQRLDRVLTLIHEGNRQPIEQVFRRCCWDQNRTLPDEMLLVHRSGAMEYSVEVTASPIRDCDNAVIGAIMVFHDVTELRGMARQMSYQATHDALTGLINRWEFETRLGDALADARERDIQHALMYIDLDQFKVVNDTCGHLAGDELLKQLTLLFQGTIRSQDVLARLGGDEFGVLVRDCRLDDARVIADKLRQVVRDFRYSWQDRSFDLGVSVGLVPVNRASHDLPELFSAADAACYIAKDQGRNRIHVYSPDDEIVASRRGEMQWVHRISHALSEQRLRLYYQPVVPLADPNTGHYCEILLRMIDESGNLVPPMAFIPAAERYQLMTTLDRWVVENVLAIMGEGNTALEAYATCAINLSGQSLCDTHFLDFILAQISAHRVDPARICFEITETSAIANLQLATRFIAQLRALGCRFALDDFGSGLSSFGYLKNLEVDYLKIDGRFVEDIVDDPIDCAMVEAVNQIGHVMGKLTIAEFVETEQVRERLREIGVDFVQGYGVAPPQPLEEASVAPLCRAAQ